MEYQPDIIKETKKRHLTEEEKNERLEYCLERYENPSENEKKPNWV